MESLPGLVADSVRKILRTLAVTEPNVSIPKPDDEWLDKKSRVMWAREKVLYISKRARYVVNTNAAIE